MAERLEFVAGFKDNASPGVKKLGKALEGIRPSHGMAAADAWMKDFRGQAEKTVGVLRPVTGMMNAVGVGGLAASLSIGEMVKQFRDLADSTLTMRELGRQTGLTIDQIRQLQYVAGKLHVDPSAISNALSSWSGKMLDFRRHVGDFYNYLQQNRNGDVAAKILGDSPEQGFKDTLDYLARIPAAAMKAGKSAADAVQIQKRVADEAGLGDLLPMLGKGPDGLASAFADAAREVQPMTQAMIEAADRMNDSTNRMNQSWQNLKNDIGPSVLDPMSHMIDRLDDGLKAVAASPGDAAAGAALIAGSFAAFWARARIMRGSRLAGGTGFDRAAGEMLTAGETQGGAAKTFAEAVAEFRADVREMNARGGTPAGDAPGTAVKEAEKDAAKLAPGALPFMGAGTVAAAAAAILAGGAAAGAMNAPHTDDYGRDAGTWGGDAPGKDGAGRPAPRPTVTFGTMWEWFKNKIGLDSTTQGTDAASLYRAYDGRGGKESGDLKRDVQEGSKAGIVQGLREMAQEAQLAGGGLGASDPIQGWASGRGGGGMHGTAPSIRFNRQHARGGGSAPVAPFHLDGSQSKQLGDGIRLASQHLGIDPKDLATAISYETGGTMDPWKAGPHTKWGWHHGLIQWGEPQARQYGVSARSTIGEQMAAVEHYLRDAGVRPGMSLLDVYSAINAGHVGKPGASDRPGMTVASHVQGMLHSAHRAALDRLDRQAGSPSGPSQAAQTAADLYKARLRALNGAAPHAAGGPIRGRGTGTSDSIPAWLSNGEFVVRAGAASRFLPLLHAINGDRLPGYAGGGLVAARLARHRSWRSFFTRPTRDGGMGVPAHVALGASVHAFEVPANPGLEVLKRLPNVATLERESGGRVRHEIDPVQIDVRHHPHTGRPMLSARAGRGVRLNIRTAPTMRAT